MQIRTSADSKDVTFIDGKTVFRTQVLAPGVVFFAISGYIGYELSRPTMEIPARELEKAKRVVVLVDGWEITGMNTQFREEWTEWLREIRHEFRGLFLIKSALMAMAANVANMVAGLRIVETYNDPIKFELDCAKIYPGFTYRRRSIPAR